ncbi:MAG: anti-sigma factor antagonist [Caldilineae bacterium]|nr:MAG: anti-sigma factor antagonist [Caldilineae bacterium]
MEIHVERDNTIAVVAVSGDVDAGTAPQLRQQFDELLGDGEQNFVIDLSGVAFMDSSGLATLVQLFKRVRIGHGDVRLCGLQPEVRRIFELTRLDRVFDVFPSRQEAVASYH